MKNFFTKIKNFLIDHKKSVLGAVKMLVGLIAISLITFVILLICNVLGFVDGKLQFNFEMFEALKGSPWGAVLFVFLQTGLTMLLSVIPGISMAFIILCQAIFPVTWQAFLISFISVMLSSWVMYALGRFGGYKLAVKLLGEEDCEQALKFLGKKGTVFFPLMMMFPVFPDDALTMVAGAIKMPLRWFFPSVVIGRGFGIATIVFGISIIPFDKFTAWWHWALFITACAIAVVAVFYFANKLSNYLQKRAEKEEKED